MRIRCGHLGCIGLLGRLGCIGLLLTPLVTMAEWQGGIEGGTVIRDRGNATRLRLTLTNPSRPLSQYAYAEWLNGGSDDNAYQIGYNPRYWFSDSLYAFGEARIKVDKPVLIENQQLLLAGVGNRFLDTEEQQLYVEAGVGRRNTEYTGNRDIGDNLAVVRAGFFQVLSDLIRLDLAADVERGDTLTEANVDAGIAVRAGVGAVRVSHRRRWLDYKDLPRVEDGETSLSFNYGF